MIDVSKLDYKTKIEIIKVWLEILEEKKLLCTKDKKMISEVTDYLIWEVSR